MTLTQLSAAEHRALQDEVHRINITKGWFDKPILFLEAWMLWVTEVAESWDAYYEEGLLCGWRARPQLTSELADCYIRLADDCTRFGLDLGTIVAAYQDSYESPPVERLVSIDGICMALVMRACKVAEAYRSYGLQDGYAASPEIQEAMAHLYLQLRGTCRYFGVDLQKAVTAKLEINATRPYRHGGKFA